MKRPVEREHRVRPVVLELTRSTKRGGTEVLILERHRDRSSAFDFVLLVSKDDGELAGDLRSEVLELRRTTVTNAVRTAREYRAGRYCGVIVHSPSLMIPVRLASVLLGRRRVTPVAGVHHSVVSSRSALIRRLERMTRQLEGIHIAVSPAVERRLSSEGTTSVVTVIHGLAHDFADRVHERQSQLGEKYGRPYVLCVANRRPAKDHETLILAFAGLLKERPDLKLVLAGSDTDDGTIQSLARRLGIMDSVIALGDTEFAARLMPGAECVVLSSVHEGLPVALMEAATLGIPIVSTDVGGCGTVVEHNHNGLLCPPRDPVALSAALKLVVSDYRFAERARNDAATAAHRFCVSRAVLQIDSLIGGSP